jgi:predicted nucleotidyltransferase
LAEVVRRTRATVPGLRKLVLFGSRARNEARADSDVDLVAVVDAAPQSGPRTVQWRLALIGVDAAFDLIVLSSAEWEAAAAIPGTAAAAARQEGRTLYAAE